MSDVGIRRIVELLRLVDLVLEEANAEPGDDLQIAAAIVLRAMQALTRQQQVKALRGLNRAIEEGLRS